MQKAKNSQPSSPNAGRKIPRGAWLLGGVLLLGGTAAGLYYLALRSKPFGLSENQLPSLPSGPLPTGNSNPSRSGGSRPTGNTDTRFPLQQGVRGERVKLIQRGINSLNMQGVTRLIVDGIWGPKTTAAIRTAGVPLVLNQADFQKILGYMKLSDPYAGGGVSGVGNPLATANEIAGYVKGRDTNAVLMVLRRMRSPSDYKVVSDKYKLKYVESVRKTLVTALVGDGSVFDSGAKTAFRQEFIRMGLSYDSSRDRWSLPGGLSGPKDSTGAMAVVSRSTIGYASSGAVLQLPAGTLLGMVVESGPKFIEVATGSGEIIAVDKTALQLG